ALQASNRTLTVRTVLEREGEGLTNASVGLLEACNVALALQHVCEVLLELARRHRHLVVVRRVRVAQTGQQICDRVCHGLMSIPLFMRYREPLHDSSTFHDVDRQYSIVG